MKLNYEENKKIDLMKKDLISLRHHLHKNPELAMEEKSTSNLIAKKLEELGIKAYRNIGKTGLVGVLKSGNGNKAIALRADMDALPILEETNLGYQSVNKGVMHACGHDGHMAKFSKLLFGKQNSDGSIISGLISKSKVPDFLRHLKGVVIKHKSEITHGRFTRTQLEELAKIKNLNQILFKNALINFTKNKKTIFLDSAGNKIKKSQDAYTTNEVVYIDYRKAPVTLRKPPTIAPTDMRMIFEQFFSFVGRGAGSRLAGAPLTILDESTQGIKTQDIHDFPNAINISYKYGDNKEMSDNFALSPRKIIIGQPYANNMQKASKLVIQAIDVVSQKLDEYIVTKKLQGKKTVTVEEVVEYALLHINEWVLDLESMRFNGPSSRTHQQMDFFFIPSVNTRKVLIKDAKKNKGMFSTGAKKLLKKETINGLLQLAISDISGGKLFFYF